MSADKRQKGRRRQSAPIRLGAAVGQPHGAPGQRAAVRSGRLRVAPLAVQGAMATPGAHDGEGVTFASPEAPKIPEAPEMSGARAVGGEAAVAPEEASVTLDQEQRDGAIADELAPDGRPALRGLPPITGSLSGSSNPDPQSGPETTRRAARPPRPTRPIQAFDDPPTGNGGRRPAFSPFASSPLLTPKDADEEPTAPRQPVSPRPDPTAGDAPAQLAATPLPLASDGGLAVDNVANADVAGADAAPSPDDDSPATAAPTPHLEAPEALEPLATLTPLVALGGVSPAAFVDAALAESAYAADDDATDAPLDEGTSALATAGDDVTDEDALAREHGEARLQAMDLSQQALGPLWPESAPMGATAARAPGAPDAAPSRSQWPDMTPAPQAAPPPPVYSPPAAPAAAPPLPPVAPVMPGTPLPPLGGQFGAPPPPYQSPYQAQAGAQPQPGQPGQTPGDGDAQFPTHAPWAVAASWGESSLSGPNTAAGMSYLFWWLSGIFVYFNERQNRFVRFHAMQSILLTGALTIISVLLFTVLQLFNDASAAAHQPAIAHIGWGIVIIGYALCAFAWFGAMVAAWSGTYLRIPFIGDYAERFAAPPREVYPDSPPY